MDLSCAFTRTSRVFSRYLSFFYQFTIFKYCAILQICNAKAREGGQRATRCYVILKEYVSIKIKHRYGWQWVVTSAVSPRLSFHERVRTVFHHLANTIRLIIASLLFSTLAEFRLRVNHDDDRRGGDDEFELNKPCCAIQYRVRTPVTVNRPERLNRWQAPLPLCVSHSLNIIQRPIEK